MRLKTLLSWLPTLLALAAWSGDADLSISVSVNPDPIEIGETATYTLTITNNGPDSANNVAVSNLLEKGSVFISASNGGSYDSGSHTVTWQITQLLADEMIELTMDFTANLDPTDAEIQVIFNGGIFGTLDESIFQLTVRADLVELLHTNVASAIPHGITFGPTGEFFITNPADTAVTTGMGAPIRDGEIIKVDIGAPVVVSSGEFLVNPRSVIAGSETVLYVADPVGLRDDGAGGVLADQTGRIITVNPTSGVQAILSEGNHLGTPVDVSMALNDDLLVADATGKVIAISSHSGTQTLLQSGGLLADPRAIASAIDGDIFVADGVNGILSLDPDTFVPSVLVPLGSGGVGVLDPFDLLPAWNDQLFVSDSGPGNLGSIHDIDSGSGSITQTWLSAAVTGFSEPKGLDLAQLYLNEASVTSDDNDPDTANNLFPFAAGITINVDEPDVHIMVTEGISVSDSESVSPALQINVTEGVTATDLVSVDPALQINVTEGVTTTDTVSVDPALHISVTETVTTTDQDSVAPALQINVTETVTTSDVTLQSAATGPPGISDLVFYNDPLFLGEEPTKGSITQLHVVFSELMADPPGNTQTEDVTNPIHYLLVAAGADGTFETEDCSGGVAASDVLVPIDGVTFIESFQSAVLSVGTGLALPQGKYQLMVCGDTGLVDLEGLALDGDGNEEPGGDFAANFSVAVTNLIPNPNLDTNLSGWIMTPSDPPAAVIEGLDGYLSPGSGSAAMMDDGQGVGGSMAQCLAVTEQQWYRFGGRVLQQRETGDPVDLIARVAFFDSSNCQGDPLATQEVPLRLSSLGEEWVDFEITLQAPESATEASITFGYPDNTTGTGQLYWDALFLSQDPDLIFADGFESGDLSRWQ